MMTRKRGYHEIISSVDDVSGDLSGVNVHDDPFRSGRFFVLDFLPRALSASASRLPSTGSSTVQGLGARSL